MNTGGYKDSQGFNHGSAATAALHEAFGNGTGAPGVTQPAESITRAMVPSTAAPSGVQAMAMDSDISEDSLVFSPPKKRQPARSLPLTLKRRGREPAAQGPRRPASLPRPAGRRTGQRPPSPAVRGTTERSDAHQVFTAGGPSVEERLAALEEQQKVDHNYFTRIRETLEQLQRDSLYVQGKLGDVETNQTNHLQLGVQIRRELYGARDKLQADLNKLAMTLPDTFQQKVTAVDAQILVLQNLAEGTNSEITTIKGHLENAKIMETKFTNYLTSLEEQRPQEGKTLSEAFKAVNTEVNRVKHMVGQIEQPSMSVFQHQGDGAVTKEMIEALRWIQNKVMHHDLQVGNIPELITRVSVCSGTVEMLSASYADFTTRINELEQINAAAGPATSAPLQSGGIGAAAPSQSPPGFGNPPLYRPGHHGGGCGGCGGGQAATMGQTSGGSCHCPHVDQLDVRVQALEEWRRRSRTQDPWHVSQPADGSEAPAGAPRASHERDQGGPGRGGHPDRDHGSPGRAEYGGHAKKELPLKLYGNLGAVAFKDRSIFDEKFTLQEEYRFNGVKNGDQWKVKVERYFIGRAPILKEILEFAEREDMDEVTFERFREAAGHALTEEQMQTVNAGIWGFLAACLTGSAEALFERAEMLNGLDAWRRVVRHIDHGREIHLETLRREMKTIHNRPIRDIHSVEEGIANFENTMYRYIKAGGSPMRDSEKKSDLLQILPETLRRDLVWHATDGGSFEHFRDHILSQSQKIILHTRRGINAVGDDPERRIPQGDDVSKDEADLEELMAAIGRGQVPEMDQLVAAVGRYIKGGKKGSPPPKRIRDNNGDQEKRDRPPRKCPNCNQEHESRVCPYPAIDRSQRKCWICNQVGHQSNACPNKKKAPIKAIEDMPAAAVPFFGVGAVMDEEGFQKVTKGARPMPSIAKLNDFISANSFGAFGINSITTSQKQKKQTRRKAMGKDDGCEAKIPMSEQVVPVQPSQADVEPPPAAHPEPRQPRPRRGKTRFAACHDCEHDGCHSEVPVFQDVQHEATKDMPTKMEEKQLEAYIDSAMEETIKEAEQLTMKTDEPGDTKNTTMRPGILVNVQANREPGAGHPLTKEPCNVPKEYNESKKQSVNGVSEHGNLSMVIDQERDEPNMVAAVHVKRAKVASDSGAVANVIHPDMLPDNVDFTPNTSGYHFVNAQGGIIEKFGSCKTLMKGTHGDVGCGWQAADVAKALHSVSQTTGPVEKPRQDVLYNAARCVVVPPGVVDYIMTHLNITPVMEYKREGNLWTAEVELSSFPRQGATP